MGKAGSWGRVERLEEWLRGLIVVLHLHERGG
jgi:hypothetical protein